MQDTWADDAKTAKVNDKNQPIWKTQDKVITKEDLASKEVPLPATYKSSFGTFALEEGAPFPDYVKDEKTGKPVLDKEGKIQPLKFTLSYAGSDALAAGGTALTDGKPDYEKDPPTFNYHPSAVSVVTSGVRTKTWNWAFIQACIAILILVGFESVTSMGEEAKNAKRDIPRAVLLSLLIQGVVCYLVEYFAANYFLNAGYKLPARPAPAPRSET